MFFVSQHSIYFTLYNFFGLALSWFLALQSQNQIWSTEKSTLELQNSSNHILVLKTGIDTAGKRSASALSIPRKREKQLKYRKWNCKVESSVALKIGILQDTCKSGSVWLWEAKHKYAMKT